VRGAKTIVAINEDPEAPIFRECNYGIVGEFQKVAPVLTKAIAAL
jgi:electron transfer flavoprotein alpha subunit